MTVNPGHIFAVRGRNFLAFALCSLLYALCFSNSVAYAAGPPDFRHFIDTGKLPPGIAKQIDQNGEAEIIVTLADGDVRARAAEMRKNLGVRNDNAAVLSEKMRLYRQKKDIVLAGIPGQSYGLLNDYDNFPVMFIRVNAQALAALLNMKEVKTVSENRALVPFLAESLPLINQPQAASAGDTGAGTYVAVLDTGVDYTLNAFGNCTSPGIPADTCKVAYAHDFAPDDGSLDDNPSHHGTNVSAVVLGAAPGTEILGLDVFSSDGLAYYNDILSALDWVLAEQGDPAGPYYGKIEAVNMSLGGGRYYAACPNDGLATAITNLKAAGITTAVAAGNDGYTDSIASPACSPGAVSVGAVYDTDFSSYVLNWSGCSDDRPLQDQVTCFSNSASFLTMLAPGALITAAGYTLGGTSQATPFVAGAVAVIKGQYNTITVDDVVNSMTSTGVLITDTRNSVTKPRLDLYAALLAAAPNIGVAPLSHDFGDVARGSSSAPQTFTVTNSGIGDLTLGTLSLTGTSAADFVKQNDNCSGQTLQKSVACTVDVVLSPQSGGTKTADLSIPSNDPVNPTLTATLTGASPYHSLTLSKTGTGGGSVSSVPAGINCGPDCAADYALNTGVILTATADADSAFSGWSGGSCSGSGTCGLTMTADTAVTATFNILPPVADFNSTTTSGGFPLYVSFADTSTHNPSSWLWSFGDNETSTLQNPSHNYKDAGTYTVSLTVANAGGSDSVTKTGYITVSTCGNSPVRLISGASTTEYQDLHLAVGDAADGDEIDAQAVDFTNSLDLNMTGGGAVTLKGGYRCDYLANPANTIVKGSLTVSSGTLTVENVEIQ